MVMDVRAMESASEPRIEIHPWMYLCERGSDLSRVKMLLDGLTRGIHSEWKLEQDSQGKILLV